MDGPRQMVRPGPDADPVVEEAGPGSLAGALTPEASKVDSLLEELERPTLEPPAEVPLDGELGSDPEVEREVQEEQERAGTELERLRAENDRLKLARDHANTRAGFLQQSLRDLARSAPEPAAGEPGPVSDEDAAVISYQALEDLARTAPDLPELRDRIARELVPLRALVDLARESGSVPFLRYATAAAVRDAYSRAREGAARDAHRQAVRIEQFNASREAKIRAGAIASSPAAAPIERPKTPRDMSTEELAAELDRLAPVPDVRRRR